MSEDYEMLDDVLKGKTLLVVDDEKDLREIVASELEFMGATVHQAENISTAKKILTSNDIDLVVSDIRMPGGTGIDLLDFIKSKNPEKLPVVLITGFADITPEDAYHKGAEALLNKPFRLDDLVHVVAMHTSPVKERLSHKDEVVGQCLAVTFKQSLQESVDSAALVLGRGGVSFVYEANERVDCSHNISFKLTFTDTVLEGVAQCRTKRPLTESSKKMAIALEFLFLENSSLDFFLNNCQQEDRIPYLPAIPNK